MLLQILIAMIANGVQRHQQRATSYLIGENRLLRANSAADDCVSLTANAAASPLSHIRTAVNVPKRLATIATPDTLMRWNKRLIAQKFDGSRTMLKRLRAFKDESGSLPNPL